MVRTKGDRGKLEKEEEDDEEQPRRKRKRKKGVGCQGEHGCCEPTGITGGPTKEVEAAEPKATSEGGDPNGRR